MPRHPRTAASIAGIGGAVYSALAGRLARFRGEVYPLHIGDTWLEPADGCRMQDLRVEDHPGMHRYASPQGRAELIDAVAARSGRQTRLAVGGESVLITAGATGGLGAVMGAILEPGDEVLVLAPFWPLITGIVKCFHAVPVEVPLLGRADSPETLVDLLERQRSERTAAIYVSTPNNPSGQVLPAPWLEALVSWSASAGLWIVSDDVYEDYVYAGEHVYTRAFAPERTFSVHSFSKAFGMAGNRCGYVVGPPEQMPELRKVSTHAFYSAPTASQIAATRALDGHGDAWVAEMRPRYRELGERTAARLGIEPPQGSTFLFLDVAERLDQRGLIGFLERCADRGLFLAPGPSFGPYPTHIRICFTAAEPAVIERGVEVLASLVGR